MNESVQINNAGFSLCTACLICSKPIPIYYLEDARIPHVCDECKAAIQYVKEELMKK